MVELGLGDEDGPLKRWREASCRVSDVWIYPGFRSMSAGGHRAGARDVPDAAIGVIAVGHSRCGCAEGPKCNPFPD